MWVKVNNKSIFALDPAVAERLTPMMRQYKSIKERHRNHILFFRMGDFYEMFFEDAIEVSQVLGIALSGRDCGIGERAPMCGVPHHSGDGYIQRLIQAGYKVAICEQTENPAFAKGVISRDVVRVITPGTLMEDSLLEEGSSNFLCSIYSGQGGFGLVFADISTGQVNLVELDSTDENELIGQFSSYLPREVIFNQDFVSCKKAAKFMLERLGCTAELIDHSVYNPGIVREKVAAHFGDDNFGAAGFGGDRPRCLLAMGGLLFYLGQTQKIGLERLCTVIAHKRSKYIRLGENCRANLELLRTIRGGEKKGSLLWVLDKTKTPMGKRMMKSYITNPLAERDEIERRLSATGELFGNEMLLTSLINGLSDISDLERLITRVVYGNASPRDMLGLGRSMSKLPGLKADLADVGSALLKELGREIDRLEDLPEMIFSAIESQPPANLRSGGVIRDGYDPALSELRGLMGNSQQLLADLESREREKTGIKNLRVSFNKVFGYFIEVSKSGTHLVPDSYIRKQTVSTGERYITQELKELEGRILSASDKALALEAELFEQLRMDIAGQLHRIQRSAIAVACLDVLCSFARVSLDNRYSRPNILTDERIRIKSGRHPVVELMLKDAPFVPNDVMLDSDKNQVAIITGPNMAGKSTYMRQTALIVMMAQMGCFVPAESADIGVVDGIFTRIGASDDLSTGQSTFMVEMLELSEILGIATAKSLLILDEIGRGTSTYDGMSIARAMIEHIANSNGLGAKTMFATHYQELAVMENLLDSVKNYNVAVKKREDGITFLRKIVPGAADQSYGIEVGKLAGIPNGIIERAYEILSELEGGHSSGGQYRAVPPADERDGFQISLEDLSAVGVEQRLRELVVDTLTPIEALNELFKLKKMLA